MADRCYNTRGPDGRTYHIPGCYGCADGGDHARCNCEPLPKVLSIAELRRRIDELDIELKGLRRELAEKTARRDARGGRQKPVAAEDPIEWLREHVDPQFMHVLETTLAMYPRSRGDLYAAARWTMQHYKTRESTP